MADKAEKSDAEYKVGFKNPPIETRFKKGQSGNPSGRPKKQDALRAQLKRVLRQKALVIENGRQIEMLKTEIAMTQVLNKATSGDTSAFDCLVKLTKSFGINFDEKEKSVFNLIIERSGQQYSDDEC